MRTVRELKPIERVQQLTTFVDFFVKEFSDELRYIEMLARKDLSARSKASMGTLFNIVCGLVNLAPIPGAALGFLASYKLVESAIKLAESARSAIPDDVVSIADALAANVPEIQDNHEMLRGTISEALTEGSKPIDHESMSVLARWLGHLLAQRYEHLLIERISTKPEEAIIGLARVGARRCLAYLSEHGGLGGTPQERTEKLLMAVVLGRAVTWRERTVSWFASGERLMCRDLFEDEALTAEKAYAAGAWYFYHVSERGSVDHTRAVLNSIPAGTDGETEKFDRVSEPYCYMPKYGYIRGLYEKAESVMTGSYLEPFTPWLSQRYYQPIRKEIIEQYLACGEVKCAKEENRTAELTLHKFIITKTDIGFPAYAQAIVKEDLTGLILRSGNFAGADFSGSTISGDVSYCNFAGARLYSAKFKETQSVVDSTVSFRNAEMGFSELSGAKLEGTVDLTQANLSCVNLSGAVLGHPQSEGACWYKAVLTGAEYDAIKKVQREQVAQIAARQKAQAQEFAKFNKQLTELEQRFDMLAIDVPPSAVAGVGVGAGAGAGSGVSASGTIRPVDRTDHRKHLEEICSKLEKCLQFERHAKAKFGYLHSVGSVHSTQISALEIEFERVQKQRLAAEADLQGQIDALGDRVGRLETRAEDHAKQLRTLRETLDRQRGLQVSGSLPPAERESIHEQSAIHKILSQYAKELSHKQQDLHYYIRPDVVAKILGGLTVGEYVAEVEAGKREDASKGLQAEVETYLASEDNVLLLLGEPGAGKSLFAWDSTRSRLTQYQQLLEGEAPGKTPWLPVVIELKNYRLSELNDCLTKYLQGVCRLGEEELAAIQKDRKPQHKLLVVLDGFDELKQPADGEADITKLFTDCFQSIGAEDWFEGQVKVVVNCRVRHLPDRILERQYFGHGVRQHYRRRILLPFNSKKIITYFKRRAALPEASEVGAMSVEDYQAVLTESKSVKEMVRNPFVLRLFVEALPKLRKEARVPLNRISRFDIYQGFVSQWFERNVKKLDETTKLALGIDTLGVKKVAQSFAHYAAILANEMYRRNSLVVGLSVVKSEHEAFNVWSGLENRLLDEINSSARATLTKRFNAMTVFEKRRLTRQGIPDEETYIEKYLDETCQLEEDQAESGLQAFKKTSPLRQSGEYYSFIHKSFYEYFIAVGIIQTAASDKALAERVADTLPMLAGLSGYGSRRLWQEPEALDFVCEYWAQASREQKDQLKTTWFEVIEATKGHPEYGVVGGNVATLLNWVNVSMTYKQWQDVKIPGADLRNAYLEGSDLRGADLSGAWLGRIQANQIDLRGANLAGVEFSQLAAVNLEDGCNAIAYHPTKNRVAVAEGRSVRQYDFRENCWLEPPLKGHTGSVTSVSYSVDGEWLASGSDDCTIRQWRALSGELRGAPLEGHTDGIRSVSYSVDGKWLASGSRDKTIRQWAAASGEARGAPLVGHTGVVYSVSYSVDGEWLASGSIDCTIRQWRASSGELRGVPLEGHTGTVNSVSYSGDGKWLASGSWDRTIRQWVASSGKLRGAPLKGHTDSVTSVSYSVDGKWLASGSRDFSIRQWAAASGEARGVALVGHADVVTSVSYSGDGEWLASGSWDCTIRQWPAASGELRVAPLVGHTEPVARVWVSGDGEWLTSESQDKTMRQWTIASGEQRRAPLEWHAEWIGGWSLSVDGKWLACASNGRTIRQWGSASGEARGVPLEGHTGAVTCVRYSVDGKWLASGSHDRTIRQWVAASGELRGAPLEGHTGTVTSVCYSGDGKWLASGSDDRTIRQWDAASGELRGAPLEGHTDRVNSVSYTGDGMWLASGSRDRTIRQWAAASGELRGAPLEGHAGSVTSVRYSVDGKWLMSGGWDGTVRVWRREIEARDDNFDGEAEEAEVWRLVWGSKSSLMQLSAQGMKLAGAIGLEPHQLELLRQHGYRGGYSAELEEIVDGVYEDESSDSEAKASYLPDVASNPEASSCTDTTSSEDGDGLAAGVEESKTAPEEGALASGLTGPFDLNSGQQLAELGLFSPTPASSSCSEPLESLDDEVSPGFTGN